MFTLRTVYVSSSMYGMDLKHVNKLTLTQGVLGKIKGNFFTTDLEQVRTAFEAVPWVRRATVRREWPDQLIVEVEEHEALGTWGEDGRLLSVKGDVFTANLAEADEDHELPAFDGPEGQREGSAGAVRRFAHVVRAGEPGAGGAEPVVALCVDGAVQITACRWRWAGSRTRRR